MITIESYIDCLVVLWIVKAVVNLVLSYRVVGNTRGDGDTIKVRRLFSNLTIRLANIDAPERSQPGGEQSRAILNLLVPAGSLVRLESEGKQHRGRLVAVIIKQGRDINREMVLLGEAMVYEQYCDDINDYLMLENIAKKGKRGVWLTGKPIHPSLWRKGERGETKKTEQGN